ncbi:BTB/POZ and TAZ domain-containing protein 1-like [Aristolochia californica]|uniref:BTB/POZ and TAZ domain-containing protein 1-like n=1 Tax=Aristolochia californica TaxID=171875 RepID=UPI0035D58ABF
MVEIMHVFPGSISAAGDEKVVGADVRVVTSGGRSVLAHSFVLESGSPVLENILERPRKRGSSEKIIPIVGVPCDAVVAFVQFLYTNECSEEEMERFGIHLLVLSHVFLVPSLKRRCERGLAGRLTAENVVDVLQLARLCDAAYLRVKCLKVVAGHFKAVEITEGWKFVQKHDPWLELELLQFLEEAESRRKRRLRNRRDGKLYLELSEAMECLKHICTEGCTSVGPHDKGPSRDKGPCRHFSTCQGLQRLIRHFASCGRRVPGGCSHCKRMWQLLRLHSSICDEPDSCKVPLCRQFKMKVEAEKKGDDERWKLLVRKVVSAKAMSFLSKRKRDEVMDRAM